MKIYFSLLFIALFSPSYGQVMSLAPTSSTNQIIKKNYYALSYSEDHEQPEWVFYLLTKDMPSGTYDRKNDFREDSAVNTGSASLIDYRNSGYDRGHLCPAEDMSFDLLAMSETFYLSNMSPQNSSFNRGIWKSLEGKVRKWAIKEDSLYIVVGPVFIDNRGCIGPEKVTVPGFFYKIIYDCTGDKKMIGFIIPNEKCDSKMLFQYAVTVKEIENKTSIDFFYELPDSLENRLENMIDVQLWQ